MGWASLFKAVLVRLVFAIHGIVTVLRVRNVVDPWKRFLLNLPVILLPFETILTLCLTKYGEWKWFCPSVFLYLSSVVPGIWFLNIDMYQQRIAFRDSMGWDNCSMGIAGIAPQFNYFWGLAPEQILLILLLMGRWILPKGALTRDQLSQLLLVYIGMATDILEFSLETLKEEKVICNLFLIKLILGIWSWS